MIRLLKNEVDKRHVLFIICASAKNCFRLKFHKSVSVSFVIQEG